MRRLLFALFLSACSFSQVDASDAGADASRPCDNKSDCNACQNCALQQACAVVYTNCYNNAGCNGLRMCVGNCSGDLSCKQQCYGSNPDGVNLYETMLNCVLCDQCRTDCAGYRSCS
jgi:hypothetical protein